MAMQPVVKPQETKPAPLPAYPVAPPSQTQTSSRGMVPPKHLAGGTAYAGAPRSVPHYDAGTTSVYDAPPTSWARSTDPDYWQNSPAPLVGPIRIFDPGNAQPPAAHQAPQPLPQPAAGNTAFSGPSHPVAAFTPPPAPVAVARGPNGRVLYAPPPGGPTASEMMAAHRGAFAQAVFGGIAPQAPAVTAGATPGGAVAAPAPAPQGGPFTGTVARGVPMGPDLEPGGDGVILKGQPYASSPQQVALAAQHTGANPIAMQSAAGAARDAQVDPVQHVVANPQQYSPANFVNALRGVSFRHLAMVAQALRTAMPYNPQEQAWQQLHAQNNQNLLGMPDPNSPEAKALRLRDEREQMKRAGVDYIQPSFAQPPQIDPVTGEQLY